MTSKLVLFTFALILISGITPALALPSSGEKDNACSKPKNPNAENAVGCGDADNDGKLDRYDSAPNDACIPDNTAAACNSDSDGDGLSDYDEFVYGTDPTDPNSP